MVSCITLVVRSVERYNALLKPFNNGLRLSEDIIKRAIVFIWITSALLCLPIFFLETWNDTYSTCSGPFNYDGSVSVCPETDRETFGEKEASCHISPGVCGIFNRLWTWYNFGYSGRIPT